MYIKAICEEDGLAEGDLFSCVQTSRLIAKYMAKAGHKGSLSKGVSEE